MKRLLICRMAARGTTTACCIKLIIYSIFVIFSLSSCYKESVEITGSLAGVWYLAGHTADDELTEEKEPEMVWITPSSPDPESGLVLMELTPRTEDTFNASFYQLPPSYFSGNQVNFWTDYLNFFVSASELSLKSMTAGYAGSTWKISYVSEKEIIIRSKVLPDGNNNDSAGKDYHIVFRKLK